MAAPSMATRLFPPGSARVPRCLAVVLSVLLLVQLALFGRSLWSRERLAPSPPPQLAPPFAPPGSSSPPRPLPGAAAPVDLGWHAPARTPINNLTGVLGGEGVYGFIYDASETPAGQYGTYNWCNMPHVRRAEYVRPAEDYELVYVELIHRHHKRTPYASNAFPVEPYHWDCGDEGLFYYGQPAGGAGRRAAPGYWQGQISAVNPFVPPGWVGTCQFPQITAGGLDDSWQHGADLYGVYHDLLGFLPGRGGDGWRGKVAYRVTNNVITSQVAGMVIGGMYGDAAGGGVPLRVQAAGVDSLEPQYPCPAAGRAFAAVQSGRDADWAAHLAGAAPLYAALDDLSGVPAGDAGFHASLDHYYDNLSARQCHAKPLPCKLVGGRNSTACVTQALADAVYRLGHWEYSRVYRDAPAGLAASAASLGVWLAELAAHLRGVLDGTGATLWFHNVAHDGSVSRLLSVLQVDTMVWPGMGSEVVFEVWRRRGGGTGPAPPGGGRHYVRVLFMGKVLTSSNPSLGVMDMLPVETLLAYFDGLVGVNASLVKAKCNA